HREPASIVPNALASAIGEAVVAACDELDGTRDGLVEDPRRCQFDMARLLCSSSNSSNCLTTAQLEGVKQLYAGPGNPRTGERIYPGYALGSESQWPGWISGPNPNFGIFSILNPALRDIVFEDPAWDWKTYDFDRDVVFSDAKVGHALNHTNPDLRI